MLIIVIADGVPLVDLTGCFHYVVCESPRAVWAYRWCHEPRLEGIWCIKQKEWYISSMVDGRNDNCFHRDKPRPFYRQGRGKTTNSQGEWRSVLPKVAPNKYTENGFLLVFSPKRPILHCWGVSYHLIYICICVNNHWQTFTPLSCIHTSGFHRLYSSTLPSF